MKTCPPEVFWTSYHTHKPITRKNPLHFQDLVKKWRFLTNFFTSTKIFTCLVNKCWPKFFHDKKALIFPYTTLTSNFSYLLWLRKYFVLKIKYTRPPFSNNYLDLRKFFSISKKWIFYFKAFLHCVQDVMPKTLQQKFTRLLLWRHETSRLNFFVLHQFRQRFGLLSISVKWISTWNQIFSLGFPYKKCYIMFFFTIFA